MIEPGTQVGGYRVESVLGRGGMGVVYEATQLSLNRVVALKILSPQFRDDPSFRERFRREGQLQAAIDHPHIVTVHEAGEFDEGLFIAMRLIRGSTLKDLIVAGELEGEEAVRVLKPVADALDTAHAAGLTHRDIKPQNILVDARRHAYLADFGLTRIATESGLTKTGHFVGTIDYIAPEQIRGEEAGAASDVYSLTAVLYECLCGTVPYPKPSDLAVLYAHIQNPPPRVTEQRPELPPALDEVIARGMAKDASERQPSARAMIAEAERAIRTPARGTPTLDADVPATVVRETTGSREPQAAERPAPESAAEPEPVAAPAAEPEPVAAPAAGAAGPRIGPSSPGGRRTRAVALAAAALLVLAVIAAAATLGGGGSDPPASTPAATTTTTATATTGDSRERQGDPITMRSVAGTTAVANAVLVDYGQPPPTIRIELTPGGPRYQLLLFQTLESVRRVNGIPESAMLVLGSGARGDLSTGEAKETGYTRIYGVTLPANFRRFEYFGVARVTGTRRELVVYDRVERLSDPR